MASLHENYLDLVRDSLYNSEKSVKNQKKRLSFSDRAGNKDTTKSKKKAKSKKQLENNIEGNKLALGIDLKTASKNKLTATVQNGSTTGDFVCTSGVLLSPSQSSVLVDPEACKTLKNGKSKKRLSSTIDSPKVLQKRKKTEQLETQTKLTFSDTSSDERNNISKSQVSNKPSRKGKTKKKTSHTLSLKDLKPTKSVIQKECTHQNLFRNALKSLSEEIFSNNSQINKEKRPSPKINRKKKISTKLNSEVENLKIPETDFENPADFYDDSTVTVKGLNLKKICDLFPTTSYEQMVTPTFTLHIPEKHFKSSESDNFDDTKNVYNLNLENKATIADTPNGAKKHKINVLDIQIITPTKVNNKVESQYLEEADNSFESIEELPKDPSDYVDVLNWHEGSKIIILKQLNENVHFNGFCQLEILNGEIEILGASLNKQSGKVKLFSPRGSALLYLKNMSAVLESENNMNLKDLLNDENLDMNYKIENAVLLCKALYDPNIEFIESHIAQQIFPKSDALTPRLDFDLQGNFNKIQDSKIWKDILKHLPDNCKTVICGGKGVGKSTFMRYAANILIRKFKKVRIVDLDPGQSEFNPPGCVSITTIDEYLLGANYTHLQPPDVSILCYINIRDNIKQYLNSVKLLLCQLKNMDTLPTLINFPGYSQGLGLNIAISILKLIQNPTHLIEIRSKNITKNYKIEMACENVNEFIQSKEMNPLQVDDSFNINYQYIKLDSLAEKNEAWSLEARQAREMSTIAYFGRMLSENVQDLISPNISMFSINISALKIVNYEGKIINPLAINANIVSLCSVDVDNEILFSHGYGFIRGLDIEQDILVLLTPEPIEKLEIVTHLALRSGGTPPSLIMSTNDIKGNIPYVNVGDLVDMGQFTKRSYLPPRK